MALNMVTAGKLFSFLEPAPPPAENSTNESVTMIINER